MQGYGEWVSKSDSILLPQVFGQVPVNLVNKMLMNYQFLIAIGICLVIFIVTSTIMGRVLINNGLKESDFYNFDTWSLFVKLMKDQKPSIYKVLFGVNISSLLTFIALIIIAANYYNQVQT